MRNDVGSAIGADVQVEVYPVLHRLRLWDDLEQDAAALTDAASGIHRCSRVPYGRGRSPGESAVHSGHIVLSRSTLAQKVGDQCGVVLDDVVQSLRPEGREPVRVGAIDADLVCDSHPRTLILTPDSRSVPSVTIHTSDPFATPEDAKSAVRRLRGRLPAAVTLWTAYAGDGRPAGLTVSSTLVIDGDPGRLAGVIDEESDLYRAVGETERFAVSVLQGSDRRLADILAGILPAPGGPFQAGWLSTEYGPVPEGGRTWVGCHLDRTTSIGWSILVMATVEVVRLGNEDQPLIHYRGRYADGPAGRPEQSG